MNTPSSSRQKSSETQAIRDADVRPIFVSVVVIIGDSRKGPQIFKARRVQTYSATPESLTALPGQLNTLVRRAGEDAQMELNQLLAVLAQPEPPPVRVPPEANLLHATLPPTEAIGAESATEQVVIRSGTPGDPQ